MARRKKPFETREQYLVAAAKRMNQALLKKIAQVSLPDVWFVSVMEPAGKVIGRAWPASHEAHHIFISAAMQDPVQVLATELHEMIHIAIGVDKKHGKEFGRVARAVGLEGKLTSTHAGEKLAEYLKALDENLRGYPHRPLDNRTKLVKKGGKRIKLVSPEDPAFHVYINPALLDEHGAPKDPWGNNMEAAA